MQPVLRRTFDLMIPGGASIRRLWAMWLGVGLALAAAALGAGVGFERLWERWLFSYDHGFLVAGMSVWLGARALRGAEIESLAPSWRGGAALLAVSSLYVAFEVLDFTTGMQAVLPLLVLGIIAAIGGLQLAVRLALPALFLYFAIPVWDLLIEPLQAMTIGAVRVALRSTGVTAFMEGSLVHIPAGTFEIAEGCSGIRYFIVALTLGAFYGLLFIDRWRNRLLLVAVAGAAAIVSNWVRVYSLVVIGDATDMQHYFVAESHDGFGWAVFVVFMLPVLAAARFLETSPAAATAPPLPARARSCAAPYRFLTAAALSSAIVAAPAFLRSSTQPAGEPAVLAARPPLPPGWKLIEGSAGVSPAFAAPDRVLGFAVQAPSGVAIDVFAAFYASQRPDAKLLAMSNEIHPGWQALSEATRRVVLGDEPRDVGEAHLGDGARSRVLLYWYLVGGVGADNRAQAKLLELWGLLRGRRDGAVIAVSAACDVACAGAVADLDDFLEFAGPWLESRIARPAQTAE